MSTTIRQGSDQRILGEDDLIVTKTDLKGRLTYCNDTFLQFSALEEDEALGRPHNIIRHPDTPQGLFQLLWSRVPAGGELFAYLSNLAADGATYWVFAYVTPSFELRDGRTVPVGYHSMRRSPRRAALTEVRDVYAGMREAEAGVPHREGGAAGLAWLEEHLAGRGLTYDTWLWSLEGGR